MFRRLVLSASPHRMVFIREVSPDKIPFTHYRIL